MDNSLAGGKCARTRNGAGEVVQCVKNMPSKQGPELNPPNPLKKLGVVVHACAPCLEQAEKERSLAFPNQPI